MNAMYIKTFRDMTHLGKKNKKTEKNKKKQKTKLKATSWSSLFHGEGNTSFDYKELIMEIALF